MVHQFELEGPRGSRIGIRPYDLKRRSVDWDEACFRFRGGGSEAGRGILIAVFVGDGSRVRDGRVVTLEIARDSMLGAVSTCRVYFIALHACQLRSTPQGVS